MAIVILSKQPIPQKDELNSATHSSKIENVSDYRKYYKNIIQEYRKLDDLEGLGFAYYSLGLYEFQEGNYKEALANYDNSLAVAGFIRFHSKRVHEAKGHALIGANRLTEAQEIFTSLIDRKQNLSASNQLYLSELHFNLGKIHKLKSELDLSRQEFEISLGLVDDLRANEKDDRGQHIYYYNSAYYYDSYEALMSLEIEDGKFDNSLSLFKRYKSVIQIIINYELLYKMNELEHQHYKENIEHKTAHEFMKLN
ncbi:MAG: hypothetical protein HOI58_06720 [Kordiimonadaceae bacterium]|nr:hypothetical protein [Kordiimonadaceae bacterium]